MHASDLIVFAANSNVFQIITSFKDSFLCIYNFIHKIWRSNNFERINIDKMYIYLIFY